ncbi:membrane-spanning 4-domains subfamily A member 13 [Delphinus delphis]|uniref:membrane-spanning 4-domains subfamily A member 13 n=1 Tax=Delphinus delphis TaxID=9728 RepID=UPI0028C37B06|nr:membrane-spanning 4-domains subfamily A member 13 [Delphinus delphis]
MIGVFSVFMWHLLLILYIGQIKGVFGTYEPITYKTGCSVWGIIKLGREISRVLLGLYPLELCIAFTYTIFGCVGLMPQSQMDKRKSRKQQEKNDFMCSVTTITADSSETMEA